MPRWRNAIVAITVLVACAPLSSPPPTARFPLASTSRNSSASAVYGAVIARLAGSAGEILLGDTTVVDGVGFSTAESIDRFLPGIPLALREAYLTHRSGQLLPGELQADLPVRRVPRDSVLQQVGVFTKTHPFVEFGQIAFSADSSAALVYAAYYCGLLCADGVLYLLRRDNTQAWAVHRYRTLWNH